MRRNYTKQGILCGRTSAFQIASFTANCGALVATVTGDWKLAYERLQETLQLHATEARAEENSFRDEQYAEREKVPA